MEPTHAERDRRELFGGPLDGEILDVTGMSEEAIKAGFYLPFPRESKEGQAAIYTPDEKGVIRFQEFVP
ncbi:hypothetical protein [Streptomyces mayteni]